MTSNFSPIFQRFDGLTRGAKAKVNLICCKATEVFSKKGFHVTTPSNVSRLTGVSKGGLYHYFSTKEELLLFILSQYEDKGVVSPAELAEENFVIFIYDF